MNRYELDKYSQPQHKVLEDNESALDLGLGDLDYSLLYISRGDPSGNSIKKMLFNLDLACLFLPYRH